MFERLAYFAVRTVLPIYLMQADDPGGLHLTASQKGTIYAWWFFFQSILPMVTGGYADRYGFKRILSLSIFMIVCGYVLMAFATGYGSFFVAVVVLASGTAFFKPSLQGSFARSLDKTNSSLGWGIFYAVANVGSFAAPLISTLILGDPHTRESWRSLFLVCAGFTSLNLLLLLTIREVSMPKPRTENPLVVFGRTILNVFEPRLMAFLLIMSGFWVMMFQLWDLQPNFINDWMDSSTIAAQFEVLPSFIYKRIIENGPGGPRVPQQILINLNPLLVTLLVVPVSWLVARMRTLSAMLIGIGFAILGILLAGLTNSAWMLLAGIGCFSLGEMLTAPKKNEYLGLIAPPDKKGLYLGYANIPAGLGGFLGSTMAGYIYGTYGEKATLALRYIAEHSPVGRSWNGSVDTLEAALGIQRTRAMAELQSLLGVDARAATQVLWDTYHPATHVWIPFAAVGAASAVALAVFARRARRWADLNP